MQFDDLFTKLKMNRQTLLGIVLLLIFVIGVTYGLANFTKALNAGKIADYLERGGKALEQGSYEQAFNFYKEALRLDAKNQTAYQGLGNIAYHLQNFEKALEFYQKAKQQDPEVLLRLAQAYLQSNQLASSQQVLTQALKLKPDSSEAKTLKELFDRKENLNDKTVFEKAQFAYEALQQDYPYLALPVLEELRDENPKYRDAHYLLAVTYVKIGEIQTAQTLLEKTLELDPNYEAAQELLQELRKESD